MNCGDSTHKRWYRIDLPASNTEEWDEEPCECDMSFDHDEGQEEWYE